MSDKEKEAILTEISSWVFFVLLGLFVFLYKQAHSQTIQLDIAVTIPEPQPEIVIDAAHVLVEPK
jgi:hypothetical protein